MLKHLKSFILLTQFTVGLTLPGGAVTAARWICYPESIRQAENQNRFFCKTIELKSGPKQGTLNFCADDACLVWINGKYYGNTGMKTLKVPVSALKNGRNLISVRVGNIKGHTGLLMRGDVTLADGSKLVIVSDASWKSSRIATKGWNSPKTGPIGKEWINARNLRGADANFIWRSQIVPADFMSREEIEGGTKPLTLVPGATGGESLARWIWVPEDISASTNQHRYFIKELRLSAAPAAGQLNFASDDACVVWINGKQRGNCGFKGVSIPAKFLRAGKNVIAIRGWNNRGHAGVLMRGDITLANGEKVAVVTDSSWKCTKSHIANWNQPGFIPGKEWSAPENLRGVNAPHVWRRFIKRENFLSREEIEQANRETSENNETTKRYRKEIPLRLAAEKNPSVRVAVRNGVSGFLADGIFYPALLYRAAAIPAHESAGRQRIRNYAASGFNLYQVSATIENELGKNFNISVVNNRLLGILGSNPNARLIIAIGLWSDPHWCRKNPDEIVGYGSGKSTKIGSNVMNDTPLTPSFASRKWRKELGEKVRKLVRYLEKSPYAPRILGYQLDYGVYSEWHSFGMWDNLPDTGKAMTMAYRRFLKAKYGSDEALRRAWKDQSATIAGALPPAKEKRLKLSCFSLRDPAKEREVLDFDACQAEEVNAAQCHFARIVKEETRGHKIVGFYSGYFFSNGFPVSAWQPKTPEILRSKLVDYHVSPYAYGQRRAGLTSLPRSVIDTYPLQGKMNIFESDTRPHFLRTESPVQAKIVHTYSTEEDIAALSRDFAQALTHGAGFWFYDFSKNNWYARPQFMPLLKRFGEIAASVNDCRRVSEVAFVCDFKSIPLQHYAAGDNPLPSQLIGGNGPELYYAGAPYDAVLTEDLLAGRTKDYKLYIFTNLVRRTPELEKLAADLRRKGKTILWVYAPGLISEQGIDPAGIAKLTGIKTRMIRDRMVMGSRMIKSDDPVLAGLAGKELKKIKEGPVFYLDDPQVKPLGTWKFNGKEQVTFGVKRIGNALSFYSTAPTLSRKLFRNIMKASGVHIYTADTLDVLFANRSLVGIHTVNGGKKTLRLPRKARRITRILPDKAVVAKDTDTITFITAKIATVLFKIEY